MAIPEILHAQVYAILDIFAQSAVIGWALNRNFWKIRMQDNKHTTSEVNNNIEKFNIIYWKFLFAYKIIISS